MPQAQGKIFLFETFLLLNISSHVVYSPEQDSRPCLILPSLSLMLQSLSLMPQSPEAQGNRSPYLRPSFLLNISLHVAGLEVMPDSTASTPDAPVLESQVLWKNKALYNHIINVSNKSNE